jgi:iron complex outermembrane receptor protein
VPYDPLAADRIEVIRNPAALMYGGDAIGGVVNTLDNRIPTEPIDGITGEVIGSYGSAANDRDGGIRVEGGNGHFAIHADMYGRSTDELHIPGYARSAQQRAIDSPDTPQPYGRLPNSDGRDSGGALGMSWTDAHGYAGLSYSGYDSNYGSVAETDVRLRMHQERVGFAAERRDLDGPFQSVKFNFAYTDYEHKEIDDGVTGTTFKNHGYEARIEARHADIGPIQGSIGLQVGQSTFSALGDEALVPTTGTTTAALFALEQWKVNDRFTLSAGAREEYTDLSPTAGGLDRFERDIAPEAGRAVFVGCGGVSELQPRKSWGLQTPGALSPNVAVVTSSRKTNSSFSKSIIAPSPVSTWNLVDSGSQLDSRCIAEPRANSYRQINSARLSWGRLSARASMNISA